MNILVNGCSFSRGPNSWPYYTAEQLDADVVNLACAGAGNTYICQTTITELAKRRYDLVLIMWSGLDRYDIAVNDIEQFNKTVCTSKYQSLQNDWPEKIVEPFNDQDLVEKNWVFGIGYLNGDQFLRQHPLFDSVYRLLDHEQNRVRSLISMITLQNTLVKLEIPYVFSFYQNYLEDLSTESELYSLLDQSKMCTVDNIFEITKRNQWYDVDGCHPNSQAHKSWADILTNFINDNHSKL